MLRRCVQGTSRILILIHLQAAFSYNIMDELVPLYASAPSSLGGLGLASNQLALPLMASGPVMIAWSVWGFPPVLRALKGILPTIRLSILLAAPLMLLIPLLVHCCQQHTRFLGHPHAQLLLHQTHRSIDLHLLYGPHQLLWAPL